MIFHADDGDDVINFNSNGFEMPFPIIINGEGGDDTLNVDGRGGPVGRIEFNGGSEASPSGDRLAFRGDGTGQSVYTPDAANNGDGMLGVPGGMITFTGLEPVEISGLASLVFVTPGSEDILTVSAATASGGEDALTITGTSDGIGFEVPVIFDVATVTVDTGTSDAGAPE